MTEYIEREAVEKAILIKREQERQHWIEFLNRYRATADYSSKEQAVDNWLRGYGEAVENLLAIFETLPTADVVEVVRCKDCWKRYKHCFDKTLEDNDFCSYGERKEGAENE